MESSIQFLHNVTQSVKNYIRWPSSVHEPQPTTEDILGYDIMKCILSGRNKRKADGPFLFSPVNLIKALLLWVDAQKDPYSVAETKKKIQSDSKVPLLLKTKNGLNISSLFYASTDTVEMTKGSNKFFKSHGTELLRSKDENSMDTITIGSARRRRECSRTY